jgi:hypothetical protein
MRDRGSIFDPITKESLCDWGGCLLQDELPLSAAEVLPLWFSADVCDYIKRLAVDPAVGDLHTGKNGANKWILMVAGLCSQLNLFITSKPAADFLVRVIEKLLRLPAVSSVASKTVLVIIQKFKCLCWIGNYDQASAAYGGTMCDEEGYRYLQELFRIRVTCAIHVAMQPIDDDFTIMHQACLAIAPEVTQLESTSGSKLVQPAENEPWWQLAKQECCGNTWSYVSPEFAGVPSSPSSPALLLLVDAAEACGMPLLTQDTFHSEDGTWRGILQGEWIKTSMLNELVWESLLSSFLVDQAVLINSDLRVDPFSTELRTGSVLGHERGWTNQLVAA